jgi:hypothetical protein
MGNPLQITLTLDELKKAVETMETNGQTSMIIQIVEEKGKQAPKDTVSPKGVVKGNFDKFKK